MANQGKAKTLNQEEHRLFLDYLANTRQSAQNKAIYLLGYRAGLRVGSIAGLRLNDVLDQETERSSRTTKGHSERTHYAVYLTHLNSERRCFLTWPSDTTEVENLFVSQKNTAFG